MALQNIEANVTLDLYQHDTTPSTVKAIQLDSQTRYVAAMLQNGGVQYDVDSEAEVQLIIVRPDKVGVQITGTTFTYGDEGSEYLGPYAELTQVALAISGKMRGQFKITSGTQILRTEIFTISNGVALDASTDEWADEYDGYNLEEMATSIETNTADIATLEADVSQIKEDFNDLDSRVEALEDDVITTLLGDTPVTLTEDTEVRLTSAGQTEYTLSGIFLADYNSNNEDAEVRLNNTTITKQGGKMIFTATGDSAETVGQCYADLRLNNLTVGDTYTLTVTRGEYISGTTGGVFVVYDRNGEELARPGEITQDVVSVDFVATTTFARVRLQPTTNYAWETYDIKTATIVSAVVSSRRSASFDGSVNLGTLESGITISSTPTCQVYSLTRDTDIGSRLAGKVCVVLGDSVAAFRTPPEDIPSIIGQQTGMTVYNCAFGGCRISDNVVAQGDTDPWEAFCLVRLTDAITSGNWAYQDAQIQSLAELDSDGYSPTDHYATLKAVDWSNVDFLIIHFAGNDPGSARFDDPNDDDNTYYYLGAFRYSIRKLLTAYPHLKLLVVGTDYHKTGGSNTDDREYTMDGQTYHYYDWSDRLMAECKNFHIPTLDWYRSNGLNALTVDYYMTSDGKHPNLIGNQLLGGQIAAKMLSQY